MQYKTYEKPFLQKTITLLNETLSHKKINPVKLNFKYTRSTYYTANLRDVLLFLQILLAMKTKKQIQPAPTRPQYI